MMTSIERREIRRYCKSTSVDYLQLKEELAARIATFAEDGKVAVVESGIDCDGVRYWGRVHTIPNTLGAFQALERECYKSRDGRFYLELMAPSQTTGITRGSRDLTLN